MRRIFLSLAAFDALVLLASFVSGVVSRLNDGLHQVDGTLYLTHFMLGLLAAVCTLLVHCLSMTYFLGTGRWVKEVCDAYGLPDGQWPRVTRDMKRQNTPSGLLAMGVTIAAAAAGEGVQHAVWPWWIHLTLAVLTLIVNGFAFVVEHRNICMNVRVMQEVEIEAERIRAAAGLLPSAEALQQDER
jgi:hypothetical protein